MGIYMVFSLGYDALHQVELIQTGGEMYKSERQLQLWRQCWKCRWQSAGDGLTLLKEARRSSEGGSFQVNGKTHGKLCEQRCQPKHLEIKRLNPEDIRLHEISQSQKEQYWMNPLR